MIPWNLSRLHTTSLLIGGPLGQAFCKLFLFFVNVSLTVSIQNLILIAVDRFGAEVFPLRSPLIRSKLCPLFVLATWIVAVAVTSPYLFANEPSRRIPRGNLVCFELEESIRRVILVFQLPTSNVHSVDIHPCDVVSHSLLHHCYEAQETGTPRWTVRQHSATAEKKKQKRASNVPCHRNSACVLLVISLYQRFNCIAHFHAFLV